MQIIESKRGRLAYRAWGDPHMPALILINGLCMPSKAWPEKFVERLVRHGLYVVAPDNRDCGEGMFHTEQVGTVQVIGNVVKYMAGASVSAPYRLEDMAGDIEELMNRLGIERAHVAGFSMGGMIAQVMATRSAHRIITLTCISTASGNRITGFGKLSAIRAIITPPPKEATDEMIERHYRNLIRTIGSPESDCDPAEIDALVDLLAKTRSTPEAGARQLMAILASGDRRAQLRQMATPTLVIHGARDPLLPVGAGREIAGLVEGSVMMEVPGMGHDLPSRHVGAIADAIAAHCYGSVLR